MKLFVPKTAHVVRQHESATRDAFQRKPGRSRSQLGTDVPNTLPSHGPLLPATRRWGDVDLCTPRPSFSCGELRVVLEGMFVPLKFGKGCQEKHCRTLPSRPRSLPVQKPKRSAAHVVCWVTVHFLCEAASLEADAFDVFALGTRQSSPNLGVRIVTKLKHTPGLYPITGSESKRQTELDHHMGISPGPQLLPSASLYPIWSKLICRGDKPAWLPFFSPLVHTVPCRRQATDLQQRCIRDQWVSFPYRNLHVSDA